MMTVVELVRTYPWNSK